jgi:aryl-alcohol dehydrogenase-like predicted oxidoreductase
VGSDMGATDRTGLSSAWIVRAVEDSLRRLQTDVIDLYQSHKFDPKTPQAETLEAYRKLIAAGKVRAVGCSNFDAGQLGEALKIADEADLPRYQTIQPLYNLYDRIDFERELRDLVIAENIGVIPYYSLAAGFLSGKYRSKADLGQSLRGKRVVERYLDDRGLKILAALDTVGGRHNATPAAISLAWLSSRNGITAPIVSATSLAQLDIIIRSVDLTLSGDDIALLDAASAPY